MLFNTEKIKKILHNLFKLLTNLLNVLIQLLIWVNLSHQVLQLFLT